MNQSYDLPQLQTCETCYEDKDLSEFTRAYPFTCRACVAKTSPFQDSEWIEGYPNHSPYRY